MNISLKDKNIIVTGASSGIGKNVSKVLGEMGANVILVSRNESKLRCICNEIKGNCKIHPFDLKRIDEISSLFKTIVQENGKLDGLVYSAGIGGARPLSLLSKKNIEDMFDINFYAFVEMVKHFSKKGNYNDYASVVAMSSIASIMGDKGKISYCASKAALDAAVRCMAKELAVKLIRVNTVRASWVKTDLYENYMENWSDNLISKSFVDRHYFGILEPSDISSMICFLLSDYSTKITGTSVLIDSGCMA